MDQGPSSRRRAAAAPPRAKAPIRLARNRQKRRQESQDEAVHSRSTAPAPNQKKDAKAGSGRAESEDRLGSTEVPSRGYFTVANVGAGGTLYLRPTRAPFPPTRPPLTPAETLDRQEHRHSEQMLERRLSSTWSIPSQTTKSKHSDPSSLKPPVSMQNGRRNWRERSRSFSNISDHMHSARSTDGPRIDVNGRDVSQRPRSSLETSREHREVALSSSSVEGLYARTSAATSSSVLLRQEYEKLFPVPPGGARVGSQMSHPFAHPSMAYTMTPPTNSAISPKPGVIDPGLYERIASNPEDPSVVRYGERSDRIAAATIARLIAQVTSPLFLDYELLSDFFLTYRCFMSCRELLEHLFARMKWALITDTDAGRIVRVRTFVAIRHWILNYFADDFLPELPLRQRLCQIVNDLTGELRKRHDEGRTDIGIMGELKKCWRRICAMFWPDPNAMESSCDVDILPGGDPAMRASATSLIRQASVNGSSRRLTRLVSMTPSESGSTAYAQSIPASPTSDHSLQVLSCSVPFLRNLAITPDTVTKAGSVSVHRTPPLDSASTFSSHHHKRSGSFSDALHDYRAQVPSAGTTAANDQPPPAVSLTGGLVRGLLLQPAPPNLDMLLPLTPGLEARNKQLGAEEPVPRDNNSSQTSVWKLVGGVRRALSSRINQQDSPTRGHRSTNSSDSRVSAPFSPTTPPGQTPGGHMPQGTRLDVLGAVIQESYAQAIDEDTSAVAMNTHQYPYAPDSYQAPVSGQYEAPGEAPSLRLPGEFSRMDSHVTTGSRSIVIMDATGAHRFPTPPSEESPGFTFLGHADPLPDVSFLRQHHASAPLYLGIEKEVGLGDLASTPTTADIEVYGPYPGEVHATPGAHPEEDSESDIDPSQALPKPLRRRPGGDLRTADVVQDLEPAPHDDALDSSSLISQDLSGTHFSGQDISEWRMPLNVVPGPRNRGSWALLDTHSSQPNLRASMQSYASHLRKLPDNTDNGIEDALLKLEGKSPAESMNPQQDRWPVHAFHKNVAGSSAPEEPIQLFPDSALSGLSAQASPETNRQGASIMGFPLSDGRASSSMIIQQNSGPHESDAQRKASRGQQSFLLNDAESLSDISTTIGDIADDESNAVRSFFFDDSAEAEKRFRRLANATMTPPPTITSVGARPGTAHRLKEAASAPKLLPSALEGKPLPRLPSEARPKPYHAHLPFVLAFDSEVIAEQLTIIEKDALDEIDWKDLIGLIWHQTPPPVRNWVEYLGYEDSNGIDVVVARFNLAVKWIVSECVLVELPSERARCITKYIHIASHCLRFRNYASMYQITLALLSSDLARLRQTWALVPLAERQLLAKLEKLCQPIRNFQNLRLEMEDCSPERGCIPFIGLYTHDLMYNAQKPGRYDPTPPGQENLVNFERYQTAATIVKSLLRLIDASSGYSFRPHPEVLSRCLWLAALDDHEIHARSLALEDSS